MSVFVCIEQKVRLTITAFQFDVYKRTRSTLPGDPSSTGLLASQLKAFLAEIRITREVIRREVHWELVAADIFYANAMDLQQVLLEVCRALVPAYMAISMSLQM